MNISLKKVINPFSTNVPPLYLPKTSENRTPNRRLSDVFRSYRRGTLVENGLKKKNSLII